MTRAALLLAVAIGTGCAVARKPQPVPVMVYCTVPAPALPDLTCPPRETPADVIRCAEARLKARADYESKLRAALAACRAPSPASGPLSPVGSPPTTSETPPTHSGTACPPDNTIRMVAR